MYRLTTYGPYLIFLAAILWASDAPFRAPLVGVVSSEVIVLLEHVIATILVLPFLYMGRREIVALTLRQWLAVIGIGIGGSALALWLFTQSFAYMNPSVVILLQKMQPLIAIALAVWCLGESTSRRFWVWAGLALLSAYLVSFPEIVPQLYVGEEFNPHIIGVLYALGAALLWGSATVMGRYLLATVSFKTVTALRFSVATMFLFGVVTAPGSLPEITLLSSAQWLAIGIISITSGAVAMSVYYYGLARAKASVATIAELGFPFGAVFINYIFLDARLAPLQLVGMVALVAAVYYLGKNQLVK